MSKHWIAKTTKKKDLCEFILWLRKWKESGNRILLKEFYLHCAKKGSTIILV